MAPSVGLDREHVVDEAVAVLEEVGRVDQAGRAAEGPALEDRP